MFNTLKKKIEQRFKEMVAAGAILFRLEIDRELIWAKYLGGFPDEATRQEHNCNCCKSFLRQYAGIVTIENNKIKTLWDIELEGLYKKPIQAVHKYVSSLPITNAFLTNTTHLGTDHNLDSKRDVVWEHFYLPLPNRFLKLDGSIDSELSHLRAAKEVFKRSLDELTMDSVDTVLELIGQNSLYRGKEFETPLLKFKQAKEEYAKVPAKLKDNFCWLSAASTQGMYIKIRNTSIGTLLVDLSEGTNLETAVTKFEKVVAPTNYKRPTALVTPRMVEEAKTKLQELGYLESLERRFAVESDLNVNNLLFVDKSSSLTDVFEEIKKDSQINLKTFSKVEEIGIADFISKILPSAKAVYALLENRHVNKMVTMLTAVNGSPGMFKWDNQFSWAYTGGITDSIKERVKQAGGSVDGEVRVSLSWHNYDDLDLHVIEPNGNRIYFSNKRSYATGGMLDVDMNAGSGTTRNAVENITWQHKDEMLQGRYKVVVNNFCKRESVDAGFEVQIECRGEVWDFAFNKNPTNGGDITVAQFSYNAKTGLSMMTEAKQTVVDKEKWNLKTNRFHKVKQIMLSPNCWKKRTGNLHHLFILENCASDEPARPFFNEYLKEELTPHRKFFEILGGKLSISPTTKQLAGLGFSETQHDHLHVKVVGKFERILKINF